MIKCTEIMQNSSSIYMSMDHTTYINMNNVKYIILSKGKFNGRNMYNIRFIDKDYMLVISEELDKQFKLD